MFDARTVLQSMNNRRFDTAQEFRNELSQVISGHLANLPPEMGTVEVANLVQRNQWLRMDEGKLLFQIPPLDHR